MKKPILAIALMLFAALVLAMAQPPDACGLHDSFWAHVYKPQRLEVQAACVTVTGVIVDATAGKRRDGMRHEGDGDCHGWLKLDDGQEQYLNAGNLSHEDGNLVFEAVCSYPVRQSDAVEACRDWSSPLTIPPVGTRVKIAGSWVKDDNHARWFEIHPVFAFEAPAK